MDEIKDKIILAVKKAITNRAEVVDCYHDIMEIDCNDVDYIAEEVAKCVASASSDALTAWKKRAEKAEKEVATLNERAKRFKIVVPMGTTVNSFGSELYRTQPNPYGVKQLYSDEEVEDIARQRDEYKHRAEVAEERLKKLKKTEGDLTVEEEINILENLVEEAKHRSFVFEKELVKYKMAFDKAIKLAYKIRTDLDVLSCSSCEFGYAIDTCKKIGLYDDCENRWKEELLQQAEKQIEGEER